MERAGIFTWGASIRGSMENPAEVTKSGKRLCLHKNTGVVPKHMTMSLQN